MKRSAYVCLGDFYKKILTPLFYDFSKISVPLQTRGGSHYEKGDS